MPKQARNGSKAIKVLGQGQEVKKTNVSEKDKILKHFKNCRGWDNRTGFKCFKMLQKCPNRQESRARR